MIEPTSLIWSDRNLHRFILRGMVNPTSLIWSDRNLHRFSWMGPGGESITNDSRVAISPTTSSGNNYTSSLKFAYLMEGDEGMYTCDVMILETFESNTREMMLNGDYIM